MCYLFMQDEKNLEDLKEFTYKGVNDLLDYNKEWEIGSYAIGNGESKNATFKEKFTTQMKENTDEEIEDL